jgi:hypothetical protein
MARELFEFYCSKNGGGCGGFFRVRLRTNINGAYTVICPNCGHHHHREIKDGVITSDRRNDSKQVDTITVPKAAFSKEPVVMREKVLQPDMATVVEQAARFPSETAVLVDGKTKRELLWDRFAGREQ